MPRRSDPVVAVLSYIRVAVDRVSRARARLDPERYARVVDLLDDVIVRLNRVYELISDLDGFR